MAAEQLEPLERAGLLELVDPRHIEHLEWTMAFDDDPVLNVATRRALLGDAADTGRVIAASHVRTAGTVERTPDGYRFRPTG